MPVTNVPSKREYKAKMTDEWRDYLAVIGRVDRTLAVGIPGTGKTMSALTVNVENRDDVISIYVGEETAAYQITGMVGILNGDTVWQDAPGLIAWRGGKRLVVNEIDKASGDALDALMWLTDDRKTAQITLPTGEIIRPKEGFHVVATTNATFDELHDIHPALADRFSGCVCHISSPHPDAINSLPNELRKAAESLGSEKTTPGKRVSIRQFRGFAELCEAGIDRKSAARLAFRDRAEELLASIDLAAADQANKSELIGYLASSYEYPEA